MFVMKLKIVHLPLLLLVFLASCASSSLPSSSEPASSNPVTSSAVSTSSEPSSTIPDNYPFVPGHLGALPTVLGLESIPNQFPGLYIEQSDRQSNYFGGGNSAETLLKFPIPSTLEANTFQLQYFDTDSSSWQNYGTGDEYVTDYNNFVIATIDGQRLRLIAHGGPIDGYYSNEVTMAYSSIETSFTGYMLDESMSLTGVIAPYVGRGLEASFTVSSLVTSEEVIAALTYQWYRVNPYTFEHIAISGATSLSYTTVMADLGHYIAIIASGDGVNAGGFYEVISDGQVIALPVKTFASEINASSFNIHFEYALPSFDMTKLHLMDAAYRSVPIDSALLSENGTHVTITLEEATTSDELYLDYFDQYWLLIDHQIQMSTITIAIL